MKNIIHSCENCGHCDEDCTVYMENKQKNKQYGSEENGHFRAMCKDCGIKIIE